MTCDSNGIRCRRLPARLLMVAAGLMLSNGVGLASDAASRQVVLRSVDDQAESMADLARRIWDWSEVGYQEVKSSGELQVKLRNAGFEVQVGVAGMPTAFVATYGRGAPVIGLLAEFDALPGSSQAAVTQRQPRQHGAAGHACGHHLFGTASTGAAIAVSRWLSQAERPGTVRVYGTPAEEGGSGKVYMARAGLFSDADAVLHWHPSDRNQAGPVTTLANKSAKFRFRGRASHAAQAPHLGRSALDGVEAMNYMVNLMREHVPETTRIHYVITAGGHAPNVVPDFSEVYYYLRHPEVAMVETLWSRLEATAQGAAQGTGTSVDWEVLHGNYSLLPNEVLAKVIDANLRQVGGPSYDSDDRAFAVEIWDTLDSPALPLGSEREVQPFVAALQKGSTDVGDVSWSVPTAGFTAATWVPGTIAHTWQATAAGGMDIGIKGMHVATKTLALTTVDLISDSNTLRRARDEWSRRRGTQFDYRPLLGDRDPPLDYRK